MWSLHSPRTTSVATSSVVASVFVATLAVNLQIPLYKVYAHGAGLDDALIPVTFAAYALGLISVLVLLGGVSDKFGRKATILVGLGCSLTGQLVIMLSATVPALLITRVLQGVSVAITLAAATTYLRELTMDASLSAKLSGTAVAFGLASGALLTRSTMRSASDTVPPSFTLVALATAGCILAIVMLRNHRAAPHARILRLPRITRHTLPSAAALFASWSLTGVMLAAMPALPVVRQGHWDGILIFIAVAPGALIQLTRELRHPRRYLKIGYLLVAASLVLLVSGVATQSLALVMTAALLSSLSSFGFTYRGGLTTTLHAAPDAQARAVSGYYLCGYAGLGLPCVAVGKLGAMWGFERALTVYALGLASVLLTTLGLAAVLVARADRLHASISTRP